MLEFVIAATNNATTWDATDIFAESPEDAEIIKENSQGICIHSGDNDGALVIGTKDELIAYFERIVNHLKK